MQKHQQKGDTYCQYILRLTDIFMLVKEQDK